MSFVERQRGYAEILRLLVEHDFAWLLDRMGLSAQVSETFRGGEATPLSDAERVRRLFEALGPTYVKMGQILSTRPDLLPKAFLTELKRLQSEAAALPWPEVEAVATEALGRPVTEVFSSVDTEALAAASIGQVHRVTLLDGRAAVIKIQRPGIERTIRQDLSIMRSFARLAKTTGAMDPIDPVAIVDEFERSILRELDYVVEGRETDTFRDQHAGDEGLYIPEIEWEHTSERVLVMMFVEGVKVSEVKRLREAGHDLPALAQKVVDVILEQILIYGRFHADPHPGNLMVLPDGRLAMIDFGMSGRFDKATLRALGDLARDMTAEDHHALAEHLLQHGVIGFEADMRRVREDLRGLFRLLAGQRDASAAAAAMIAFVVEHKLAFPPDLFFLDKVFGTLEGAVKTLDPQLSMRALAKGVLPKLAKRRAEDWRGLLKSFALRMLEVDDALAALPVEAGRVLRRVDAGHLVVQPRWSLSEGGVRQVSRLALQVALLAVGAGWLIGAAPLGAPLALAPGAAVFAAAGVWLLRSR